MTRPPEYENLIKTGSFKAQPGTAKNVTQYLEVASAFVEDAYKVSHPATQYSLAYEGFFQMVQAILEFYDVRTTDQKGHRITAIQRVCADLKMSSGEQALVSSAHMRRNDSIYRSPFPPVSKKEAEAMLTIASAALIKAKALAGAGA